MVARLGWADAVAGAPSYVGRALRQLMSPLVAGATSARPLGSMSGVRPGTPASIVSATSTTWTVKPFAGVIDLEAAAIAGPYPFAFDANVTGSVTAANASYARVDILYVRVSDPSEGDGSSVPLIEVLYLAGTAAAVPVAPTVPARSFVIANLNVPVSGGGSTTVSFNAPFVVAAGGILPGSASTLAAASFPNQYLDDPTFGLMRSDGSYWRGVSGLVPLVPSSVTLSGGNSTVSALGKVTFTAVTTVTLNGVFSSAFDNYLVKFSSAHSAGATLYARLAVAGTANATANYSTTQMSSQNGTSAGGSSNAASYFSLGFVPTSNRTGNYDLTVFNPARADFTTVGSVGAYAATMYNTRGQLAATTVMDGIAFGTTTAGSLTGTVTVYGYNA
jgi:hypothetical protein